MTRFYVNIEQHAVIEVEADDWRAAKEEARRWCRDTDWVVTAVLDADEEDRSGVGDPVEPLVRLPDDEGFPGVDGSDGGPTLAERVLPMFDKEQT